MAEESRTDHAQLPEVLREVAGVAARNVGSVSKVWLDAAKTVVSTPPPLTPEGVEAWRALLRRYLADLLELPEGLTGPQHLPARANAAVEVVNVVANRRTASAADIRAQFEWLLQRSLDVDDVPGEPAFLDVVLALTPDEARIIRYLAVHGPTATMDLLAVPLIGNRSKVMLKHVCLVSEKAGCRSPEKCPVYLDNLARLRIVEFSDTVLDDDEEYQLLQGTAPFQEQSTYLRERTPLRPKGRRGSVRLTPFGEAFVEICLPEQRA